MRGALEAAHANIMNAIDIGELANRCDAGGMIFHGDRAKSCIDGADTEHLFSVMTVPLRAKNQSLGFLVAFAFDEKRSFTEGKRKMLSILAGRASAAIENARLYMDLKTTFKQTIQAFANLLEDKDPYTCLLYTSDAADE